MAYGEQVVQPPYARATQSKSTGPRYAFKDNWEEVVTWLTKAPDIQARYKFVFQFTAPAVLLKLANSKVRLKSERITLFDQIKLKSIQGSTGDYVNIDYYHVEFTIKDASATGDLNRLLNWFRLNINLFLRANVISGDKRVFIPHSQIEKFIWVKENPLGAIIDIIPGRKGLLFYDDMTVLVSEFCSQKSLGAYWIFSTVWCEWNQYHPVSGNRLFGIERVSADQNRFRFYASGVDGLTDTHGPDAVADVFLNRFKLGDEFWRTLFTNLENELKKAVDNKAEFKEPIRANAKKTDMDDYFDTAVFGT